MTSNLVTRKNITAAAFAPLGRAVAALALGVWRLVVAVKHRRTLARLADLDDWMLNDIGLTRGDLHDAYLERLWRDPTTMLGRRVAERRASLACGQPSSSRLRTRLTACAAHRPIDQPVT